MTRRIAVLATLAFASLAASCILDRAGVSDTSTSSSSSGSGGAAVSSSSSAQGGGGSGGDATSTPASSSSTGGGGDAGAGGGGVVWHKAGYGHRRSLMINAGSVTGSHNDFPVLVDMAAPLTGLAADGSDLIFVDANGVDLAHEVDGVGPNGVRAWVKVPSLTPQSTQLYAYYDNPAAPSAPSSVPVWSNGFVSVYHLEDDPSAPNVDVKDSTGLNPADTANSMALDDSIAAQISQGFDLDGMDDRVLTTLDVGSSFTLSMWVKPNDINNAPSLMARFGAGGGFDWYVDATKPGLGFLAGNVQESADAPIVTGAWQYVAVVVNLGNGTAQNYHNGVAQMELTGLGAAGTNESHRIGGYGTNGSFYLNGQIDEARYSSTVRSPEWLKTEYDNQLAPTSFVSVGGEEASP